MTLTDDLNRIGVDMTQRRLAAAEAVAWQALNMTPYTNETAAEFASRIRFFAERHHPEMVKRFEHSRQEILPRAEDCGCDPDGDGWGDDHCESDEGGEYLCARQRLGFVCAACVNEDDDGPGWRSDRYEWPCPTVITLDREQVAS
ncbi:hypothetical protein [Streptomyces flavidovirens]|uniref:hypothetical protein n=1 Tax=Streptomyces flavidovirens TaxID=67298 RepID=UPI003675A511